MVSFEHTQIAKVIRQLDKPPGNEHEHSNWIRAKGHLQLLKHNAGGRELILYALSPRIAFIHAVTTKESDIIPTDYNDMLNWDSSPYDERAGYSWIVGSDDVQVEFSESNPRPSRMKHRHNLVFARRAEGLDGYDSIYYELLQEFAHVTGIHWHKEQRAYCCIDENGDIEPIVSITKPNDKERITLITCKREPLEQYLAATGSALVQFFDFMMVEYDKFVSWELGVIEREIELPTLFYNQCLHPDGHAWTRGAQILPVTTPRQDLFASITGFRPHGSKPEYASFVIYDWRNDRIDEVSTDPECTTSYFEAKNNSLPFEVSPAFFRAEVLSKYKADRDKYTINEGSRTITCRGAWELKAYDMNEAGQVHAYIRYLQNLPYQEQLHWKSHNEEPKGGISLRAYEHDIMGEWSSHIPALEQVLQILRGWAKQNLDWWKIRNELLLLRVNTPVSNSRDEWAQAFLDLSKTIIENFQIGSIRTALSQEHVDFDNKEATLSLLEKLITSQDPVANRHTRLEGLRETQVVRTLAQAHNSGRKAGEIAERALMEYDTYREHFEQVCSQIAKELEQIERAFATL